MDTVRVITYYHSVAVAQAAGLARTVASSSTRTPDYDAQADP